MWNKLSGTYEQKTATNKLSLTQKFHEYRINPTDNVQHLAKVQNMARMLIDVGKTISDVAIVTKILVSLPSKFNALRIAWDSVDPIHQTLDTLQKLLIKEESFTAEDDTANAMIAVTTNENKKFTSTKQSNKNNNVTLI